MSVKLDELVNYDKTYNNLKSIRYYSGGGMDGGHHEVSIDMIKKTIKSEKCSYNGDKIIKGKNKLKEKDYQYMINLIDKYNFPEWSRVKEISEYMALDAPSETITFGYDNDFYTVSLELDCDSEASKIIYDFKWFILDLEKNK